jgi:hypothetical protein
LGAPFCCVDEPAALRALIADMAADLVVGVVDCALGVDKAATGSAFAVGNMFRVGGFLRVVVPASAFTADLKADKELIVEPEEDDEETEDDEFVR